MQLLRVCGQSYGLIYLNGISCYNHSMFIPNVIYFECIVACQLCKYNTIACTCEIFNSMMLTEMPQFNTVL